MNEPQRIGLLLLLTLTLFVLDYSLPLGVATGVLYACILFLTAASSYRRLPLISAVVASGLILLGATGPVMDSVPVWLGVTNRALSIAVMWGALFFLLQRRRAEDALQQIRNDLEMRVQQRTSELAQVNKALVAEITERIETEESLRASESALERSRLALEQSQEDLRALAARLLTAQEEERRRISRDLHDDINQRLAMMVVELVALDHAYPGIPAGLSSRLRSLQDNVSELSEDVRHLAYQYHPSMLDDLGLVVALQRLVEDCSMRTGLECTFQHRGVPDPVPPDVATSIYRITQESLNNAARHARARRIGVELSGLDAGLTLSIADDGAGFAPDQRGSGPTSLGVISMKERAHLVHGVLHIESHPGHGTTVRAHIPLRG